MSLCAMQRVWLHALAQQHVGFLTHPKNISRGVLFTLWGRRLRHELKPRRRLCNLS